MNICMTLIVLGSVLHTVITRRTRNRGGGRGNLFVGPICKTLTICMTLTVLGSVLHELVGGGGRGTLFVGCVCLWDE